MPTGGCSAVMSGGVYGRNYDFRPRGYEARFALVQARGSYASIGSTHLLTNRLDGMNDAGSRSVCIW
jgi:predicted choloylglycine hydrolase